MLVQNKNLLKLLIEQFYCLEFSFLDCGVITLYFAFVILENTFTFGGAFDNYNV